MFLLLFLYLVNLTVIQGQRYKDLSNKNSIRLLSQKGSRGRILDTEGVVLANNKLSYDVMILPQGLNNVDKILKKVSEILGIETKNLKDTLKHRFIPSSLPVTIASNIDVKKAIALEELKAELPGIIIQQNPQRTYPYGTLSAHILGYLNEIDRWRLTKLADYGYKHKDLVGFGGVEEKYDYYLRQEEGGLSFEVDHKGRFIRLLGYRAPFNGRDLQLTINLKIQKIIEDKLQGKIGSVILMEPFEGSIIAMASYPNFNPSIFVNRTDSTFISSIFKDPEAPLINRAISGVYPAGSVFKLIVATAGLETKKINLSTTFQCNGGILIGNQRFDCLHTHNQENLREAITRSCNTYFYRTGLLLGAQTIHHYALKFGLSKPTNLELPYEENGFIPSPLWRKINKFKNWFDGDTANLSIGQGEVLVTPLQMTRIMAVFANKGNLVTPHIVKAVNGKALSVYKKRITKLPFKEGTIDNIRQSLRSVVLNPSGTGNILSDLPVSVAGKTGTAQVSYGQPHAWFTGFFPYQEPKFVICVFLENAGPGYVSCVLAKRIIEEMNKQGLI
jgi:penicillin-binding protein 2